MAFTRTLLQNATIPAGAEKRLLPYINVSKWDRLHFHIGGLARSIPGLNVRILFCTPVQGGLLLADSTVWYEDTISEREFSYSTPTNYAGTGFVMSVPVVAPFLYDVILKNYGTTDIVTISVAVMA